ncbi:RNA-binding protein, putative [Bodo saltans]|uniref:RNA-binding protein, putative n=1 Tax=Bodo saltans TaxID=75058 RepID=A0A0S4JQ15_BODSA|nr:RNA-binding protein, putative [Bodo saltans]|eukprot:CUG92058.1 RNA-binding protein, putative [Bodo saltans]
MDNLINVADCLVTISQVVNEIRDRAARNVLDRLPLKLHILEPSKESIKDVMDMAAKTGDDGTMSRTDIRLCALALDCCISKECLGARIEPRDPTLNPSAQKFTTIEDTIEVDEEVEEEEEIAEEGTDATTVGAAVQGAGAVVAEGDGNWSDDGEGDWITPQNIEKVQRDAEITNGATDFTGGVACVTSDFAMQNTLMHLGVPIVGPRGMRIRELRLWLLRCHACYRVVTDTTKQFCPDCGSGDTLRRVNYVVHDNGEKELFINFSRRISTRGTIYGLPKPRGGRKGTNRNLVLREDQLASVLRARAGAGKSGANAGKLQAVLEDDDELAVFGTMSVRKKHDIDAAKEYSAYKRFNINDRRKARAGRRK